MPSARIVTALIVAVVTMGAKGAAAKAPEPREAEYQELARRLIAEHGFHASFAPPDLANVRGKVVGREDQVTATRLLIAWAARYPPDFVRTFVDRVTVVDKLVVDGERARGYRAGRILHLQFDGPGGRMRLRDLDHELFHAIDGQLAQIEIARAWHTERDRAVRLRDLWDDYRLTPSHRYTFTRDGVGAKPPWFAYVPLVGLPWLFTHDPDQAPDGFALAGGVVAPREDRATVAEALLMGDDRFLRRAAGDRELREKVAIIKSMYLVASEGQIDDRFWRRLADYPVDLPSLVEMEQRMWPAAMRPEAMPSPSPSLSSSSSSSSSSADRQPEYVLAGPPVVATVVGPPPPAAPPAATPRPIPTPRSTPQSTVTPRPTPQSTVTPRPTPSATPQPSPAAKPTPTPRAAGPADPKSPAQAYAAGLEAFRARDSQRAVATWLSMLKAVDADFGTIQIAINCQFENAEKNLAALAGTASFYVLPYRHGGRDCFLSMSGLYRSRDEAEQALAGLPQEIRDQKPRPKSVGDVLAALPRN